MFASKTVRAGLTALAIGAATLGVAAPASAAGTNPVEVAVWNASGVGPGGALTISLKCPSTNPYVVSGVASGTNGAVLGPLTLVDYPALSKLPFSNPWPLNTDIRVTARIDMVCSKVKPVA